MRRYLNNLKKGKLTNQERLYFLDYLKNSLSNGFSLNSSLELLPILWPKRKEIVTTMGKNIQSGSNLSEEMLKMGFSRTLATQIELAMEQGSLVECLSQLAKLNRLKNEQVKKLKVEMSYPFILVIMMIFLLIFMQTFVSNQFADTKENTGNAMLLLLLLLCCFFIYYLTRILALLKKQDYCSLKKLAHYPIVGSLVRLYVEYLLVYDVGLLISSGFSLQKMCEYASKQKQGSLQQYIGQKIGIKLKSGKSLTEIIENEFFLPEEIEMLIHTGSTKEDLSSHLILLSRALFNDLAGKIERLIVNVQPLCFILIGLCIIGMYLKLLLPMYAMMQSI